MTDQLILTAIVLSALVTWIPRVIPFILTKYTTLPKASIRLLNYLPLAIIFTLTLSSLVHETPGQLPRLNSLEVLAVIPTFWVASKSQNILLAVLTGMIAIALLRFIF